MYWLNRFPSARPNLMISSSIPHYAPRYLFRFLPFPFSVSLLFYVLRLSGSLPFCCQPPIFLIYHHESPTIADEAEVQIIANEEPQQTTENHDGKLTQP